MKKIYFEDRSINICLPGEQVLNDPNGVEYLLGEDKDVRMLVELFEISRSLHKIYAPTDDMEGTYKLICSQFAEVNAAGGLVSNRRGDYLLIRRYGRWDLPKGHQEAGEDISLTALREVREETGVDKLKLRKLICVTDHCYFRDGKWQLKHTWWYDMLYTDPVNLTPQREEDISKAVWVAKSSLPPLLKNTYPSIVEVFHEAKV